MKVLNSRFINQFLVRREYLPISKSSVKSAVLLDNINIFFSIFSRFPSGNKFGAQLEENNPKDYQLDSFFSTIQNRHTYFQRPKSKITAKKRHIRLRARQVLCHNCKNVCTENGKNAQKYKTSEVVRFSTRRRKGSNFEADRAKFRNLCVKTFTLVPRLKRLKEIGNYKTYFS